MAVGKPARVVRLRVPRHNSQRLNNKLAVQVKSQAKAERIKIDTYQPNKESILQAIESASDWNSRLITARAQRGPQWDVGTQQFLVEEHSKLYYDPSVLQEASKKQLQEELGEDPDQIHLREQQARERQLHQLQQLQQQREQRLPPQPPLPQTPRREPPRDFHLSSPQHPMGGQMHEPPFRGGPGPPGAGFSPFQTSPMRGGPAPYPQSPTGPPGFGSMGPPPPGQFHGPEGGSPMRPPMGGMGGAGGMGMGMNMPGAMHQRQFSQGGMGPMGAGGGMPGGMGGGMGHGPGAMGPPRMAPGMGAMNGPPGMGMGGMGMGGGMGGPMGTGGIPPGMNPMGGGERPPMGGMMDVPHDMRRQMPSGMGDESFYMQ